MGFNSSILGESQIYFHQKDREKKDININTKTAHTRIGESQNNNITMKQFALHAFLSLALPFLVMAEYGAARYNEEGFEKVNIYVSSYDCDNLFFFF